MSSRRLSPIEFTVLGIAWKRGPSTTYALMKELSASNSTYYRSKAGTIYPLVSRLVSLGLLEQDDSRGDRAERKVWITPAGEESIREWVSQPIPFSDVAYTVDFIRLRVFYLGLLSAPEQAAFVERARAQLQEQMRLCQDLMAHYTEIGDGFSQMATRGVILETEARLEWLSEIASGLSD